MNGRARRRRFEQVEAWQYVILISREIEARLRGFLLDRLTLRRALFRFRFRRFHNRRKRSRNRRWRGFVSRCWLIRDIAVKWFACHLRIHWRLVAFAEEPDDPSRKAIDPNANISPDKGRRVSDI